MMENMNEMTNMEIANEATTDLVETTVESGTSNSIGGFLLRTAITIGIWEGGKRLGSFAVKKAAGMIAKAEENKRIKQAKKIESEEVVDTEAVVEDIEKTHPIE